MSGVGSNFSQVNSFNKVNTENKTISVKPSNLKLEALRPKEDLSVVFSRYSSITQKSGNATPSISFLDNVVNSGILVTDRQVSIQRAENMISDLKLKSGGSESKLAKEVEKILKQSPHENQEIVEQRRSDFVNYFNLDSAENFNALTSAMITEAGMFDSRDEDNFAVGTVIMNRVLSANIFEKASDSGKKYSVDRVIREKSQFQIVTNNRYDLELSTGNDRFLYDNSNLAKDILKGKFKDPEKGKDYSNMYYFQVQGLPTHGRVISYKTPNGHVFSHGYDKKNLTYPNNNMLSLAPAHSYVAKPKKTKKVK